MYESCCLSCAFVWRCIKPFHEGVMFCLFTHALIPLFLNASCCCWNIWRRVIAQFVSYGALANLPVDKPINHSGFIMSLSFYLFLYFLLQWQKSVFNAENAHIWGHWRELRYWKAFCVEGNNPICLLVEHIFHLYSVKKPKTFLVVCSVSVFVPAKQWFEFQLKLTLSTLCCSFRGKNVCLILLQYKM